MYKYNNFLSLLNIYNMASYEPPTENLAIFDPSVFITGDEALTYNEAVKKFLKYPNAQGLENLQAINVNGIAEFNTTANFNSTTTFDGNATFNATSDIIQVSGSGILQQPASTYISGPPNVLNRTAIITDAGVGTTTTLTIADNVSDNTLFFVPNASNNAYDNIVNAGDFAITTANATPLVLSNGDGTSTNGIRIDTTQLLLGYGGSADIPTNNIAFNTASGIVITSPNPPTSTATQPASNDSSTKMPTTAWTQGAIDAKIPASLLGLNNTWTGTQNWTNTGVGSLTSSATQPASSDSSTKIPTTAWVQGAITAGVSSSVPVGSTIAWAGNTTAPTGWLFCQGQGVSTTTYSALFAVIGYTYGGSGATFNLPTMMSNSSNIGIFPAGSAFTTNTGFRVNGDSVNTVYPVKISSVGSQDQLLYTNQLPPHTHQLTFPTSTYVNNVNTTNNTTTGGSSTRAVSDSDSTFPTSTGNQAYGNLKTQAEYTPIYTAFTWIIKF